MSFEERLRHELQRASAALPVVGVDLDETMRMGRKARRRTMMVAAAAAAALIALGIAGAAVLTRPELGPRPQPPSGTPTETTPPGETPSPSDGPTPEQRASFDRVEPVLQEWLRAIQDGDEDRAWGLMTPEAQAEVGRELFDELMGSALPEGLGAFADASGFEYVVVSSEGDDGRVVAVVSGEVTREGTTEFAAMAIPMRVRAGETLVDDPIVDRDRYYDRMAVFAAVSAGPFSFHAGDELIVEFSRPAGAMEVFVAVDGRRPLPTEFDPDSGRAAASLDRDLEAGRHIAVVGVLHRSGRIYPEAIVFEAAPP